MASAPSVSTPLANTALTSSERGSSSCRIGDLTFTGGPVIFRDGQEIYLSEMESALLCHLVVNRGRVVSRAELLAYLYPDHPAASANIIEVMVMRLRRKLAPHGEADVVLTLRGRGYQIPAEGAAALPPPRISPFSWRAREAMRRQALTVG